MNQTIKHYIRNGLYIPLIHFFMYYITNNLFLSTIIAFKMYPANYYYWFSSFYKYENLPQNLYFIKQFVRFTDSGHIASFIYLFCPKFYPIAYNIHFVITLGYWSGKLFFNMIDEDDIFTSFNITLFENMWSYSIHIFPLILFIRELWINPTICNNDFFNMSDLCYSYLWLYTWFFCIYIPWRLITHDYVYTILSPDTPIKNTFYFILFMNFIFYIANISGYVLHSTYCLIN